MQKQSTIMKRKLYHLAGIIGLMAPALSAGCSDWDDHYENSNAAGTQQNIMQILQQDEQTSVFAGMLKQSGYDALLSSTQSFTVFAPSNDALDGIDTHDTENVKRLVSNHFARYTHPTSTQAGQGIRMYNGKIYYFDNSASFSGSPLSSANEKAKNGILHRLTKQIPYANNLYEYIQYTANTSKIYKFIHQFDETIMDMDQSIEVDIDEEGRPVYDTVMVKYNRLLENPAYGIGSIATEDSAYTMLVPTDAAWDAAYERIAPSFKVYDKEQSKADSIQDVRTCLAIVSDLIYRGSMAEPASADSLTSTSGSIIRQPAALFADATGSKGSNGYIFTTEALGYDNTETWNKAIGVEAEQQNGRTYNNTLTSVYTRTVTAESMVEGISGDSYIEVMPISTSTNPTVIFDIPDVLAGSYNVYAVFLPVTVGGFTEELDSTCIGFTVSYLNDKGRTTTKNNKAKTLLTSGSHVTKMLAFENLEIPVSNYTDRLWLMDDANDKSSIQTTTQLTITTNVTTKEFTSKLLSRSFRLDRIIFEPVKK